MYHVSVIGIGTGGAEDITLSATSEMQQLDTVVFLDKGSATTDMREFRRSVLRCHAVAATVLELHDPPRDRHPVDYQAEVKRWHQARADLISEAPTGSPRRWQSGLSGVGGPQSIRLDTTHRACHRR